MIKIQPHIIGRLLVDRSAISQEELDAALDRQPGTGRRLGDILLGDGLINDETLARALGDQLGLPFDPGPLEPQREAARLVRPDLARSRFVVPLTITPRVLTL